MKLNRALALVREGADAARRRRVFLACGFEPLHLVTFLKAHFAERFPDQAADVEVGSYGDLEGSLAAAAESQCEAAAVVVEWSDLDPRLGVRSAGGWAPSIQEDIASTSGSRCDRLLGALERLASKLPVALVLPTLPAPLVGHTAGWQMSPIELELQRRAASLAADAARLPGVAVLNPSRLARESPEASRLDAMTELKAGFPYTLAHASALARQTLDLLFPPSPMKGLITDLDDTLWSGLVGEVGPENVSWSLAEGSQIHGLYQQQLHHLSEIGVLLAICSKNEPTVVEEAMRRKDLHVPAKCFFPVHSGWGPKSRSVEATLRTWNVAAESVVFVDDDPMEIEEVRTAFPSMTCLQFSPRQPAKAFEMLEHLRDLFGKPAILGDDALRLSSIRAQASFQKVANAAVDDAFVRELRGRVIFDLRRDRLNRRLLELINKTNQFNLNGIRITEGEWLRHLEDPEGFVIGVGYEDKFGPLGTIGVLAGRRSEGEVELTSWVLSCRAFSRKLEDHMLDFLFAHQGVSSVRIAFCPTERNQHLRRYLTRFGLDLDRSGELLVSKQQFRDLVLDVPLEVLVQPDV